MGSDRRLTRVPHPNLHKPQTSGGNLDSSKTTSGGHGDVSGPGSLCTLLRKAKVFQAPLVVLQWRRRTRARCCFVSLLLSVSQDIYGPMAAPAVREVRAPAIPFVARPPLATICLPGDAFRLRSPTCALALAHGACLAETAHSHARTQAICLFMQMNTNRRKDPACRALRYKTKFGEPTAGVDVFLILQEEEPEMFEHPLPLGDDSS